MMNKDMEKRVLAAIRRTYEGIASDLGDHDLDIAVETCIDADRTATFGGDAEAAAALYAIDTWPAMCKLGKKALKGYF